MTGPALIAADWGTSHLRVWLLDASGSVIDRRNSAAGMGTRAPDGFEPALLDLVGDALAADRATPVVICGMAGARQGWAETPYVPVPCEAPDARAARLVGTTDPRLRVHILPGLSQTHPPDVMRGEETQIGGFVALNPGFDGVLCLPGTHSKWAHVSAKEIVSFRTYLTGELFALLSRQSVLRHTVAQAGWDDAAFDAACDEAMTRPQIVAGALFGLRAEALLGDLAPETARARLSGLLIGLELGAAKPYWLGREVVLIGEDRLAAAYRRALTAQGCPVTLTDADRMTLEGLKSAFAPLRDRT